MSYDDLSDHPMAIFHANETYDTPSDCKWLAWVRKVERMLGHSLDGNDENKAGEGYSLDEAYDWWRAGEGVVAYVVEVRSRHRYRGRA